MLSIQSRGTAVAAMSARGTRRYAGAESAPTLRTNAAFKTVCAELQTSKEEVKRFQEKSRHLELAVARTEAWLASNRRTLAAVRQENARLKLAAAAASGPASLDKEPLAPEKASTHREETLATKTGDQPRRKEASISGTTETTRPDPERITFEDHELLIREVAKLKCQLTLLAREKGQDVEKILEVADYKEMIQKLRGDIQGQADENEKLVRRIQELCRKDSGPASQMVQLKFKNEKLEKQLWIRQQIIDTLCKRCEELKDEVETTGERSPRGWEEESRPRIKGEFALHSREAHLSGKDSGVQELFSKRSEDLSEEMREKEQATSEDSKVRDLTARNQQLERERQEAERQREVFEQRYNNLMETLQEIQQRECSTCRRLQQELSNARQEMADVKDMNELIKSQIKLNQEELVQEQQELASQKQRANFQIQQWKKNCQVMSQQVDLLAGDLRKEREEVQRLKAQLRSRPGLGGPKAVPIAPKFNRCSLSPSETTPMAATNLRRVPASMPNVRQMAYLDEIQCDGPGGYDEPDGHPRAEQLGRDSGRAPAPGTSLEDAGEMKVCPCCERQFPADQMERFNFHVNKCVDNA